MLKSIIIIIIILFEAQIAPNLAGLPLICLEISPLQADPLDMTDLAQYSSGSLYTFFYPRPRSPISLKKQWFFLMGNGIPKLRSGY